MKDVNKSIVEKIKEDIEKEDNDLFLKMQSENVSDEEILNNYNKIYRHLSDFNDKTLEVKLLINVENGKIVQSKKIVGDTKETLINQLVKQNILLSHGIEDFTSKELMTTLMKIKESNYSKSTQEAKIIAFYKEINQSKTPNFIIFTPLPSDFPVLVQDLVYGLLIHSAKNKKTVATIAIPLFISEVKQSFSNQESKYDYKIINNSKNSDVLFLDDLNPIYLKEWFLIDYLFPILDYRFKNGKQTFITTSTTSEELLQEIDNMVYKKILSKNIALDLKKKIINYIVYDFN